MGLVSRSRFPVHMRFVRRLVRNVPRPQPSSFYTTTVCIGPHISPLKSSGKLFSTMPPKKQEQRNDKPNGSVHPEAHQYQAGNSTDRDIDAWKHREPYRVHGDDENFTVKWKGSCHCGKVTYQLSREKPLASKYCHCTTCQRLHGVCVRLPFFEYSC